MRGNPLRQQALRGVFRRRRRLTTGQFTECQFRMICGFGADQSLRYPGLGRDTLNIYCDGFLMVKRFRVVMANQPN
jgi:hypothetical protein